MNNCTEQAHFLEVQIISTLRFSEYRPTPINMHHQNGVLYSRKKHSFVREDRVNLNSVNYVSLPYPSLYAR